MGIVNVTPDSYFEKSRSQSIDGAIAYALQLVHEGADIIDVGGESTRPQAASISVQEELERVIPVIRALSQAVSVPISIDTMKPEVAEKAIENGASMINDVTGFSDERMRKIAAASRVSCCVMHMQGTPQTMQQRPYYEKGVVAELLIWFDRQTKRLIADGIEPAKIIIDPGIGFGKTDEDNLALIKNVKSLQQLGFPLLYGISRKSFLRRLLNKPTEELLAATIAINAYLMLQGVEIIRVHDVMEHGDARIVHYFC